MAIAIPDGLTTEQHELWYYSAGAIIFCLCGLGTGYFIWRRSHLQFSEMRHEKKRSNSLLAEFNQEIEVEKKMLAESGEESVLSNVGKKDKKKSGKKKGKKKDLSRKSKKGKDSKTTVTAPSSIDTTSIEPPVNPVAKVIRGVVPIKDEEFPADKSIDDLFS